MPCYCRFFDSSYCSGRHVDAQRQRLGGEHHLHQARGEAASTASLNGGHHAGVVGGDAGLEPGEPAAVAEHVEVGVGQALDVALGDGPDPRPFLRRGQAQPGARQASTASSQPARLKMK